MDPAGQTLCRWLGNLETVDLHKVETAQGAAAKNKAARTLVALSTA